MSFLNPIGLLGLIGIPIIILIYIIKSKYKERNVSSTYIWKLSEKFLERKSPLSKISGILSLILQLLMILILSFALAKPIVTIKNSANNYLFVVDVSASMNIGSRFQDSKNKMNEMVKASNKDSKFTIILNDSTNTIMCQANTDKEKVTSIINDLEVSSMPLENTNIFSVVQEMFDKDNSLDINFFTDSSYIETKNVVVHNFSKDEFNVAINSLGATIVGDKLVFIGEVISYNKDLDVEVELFMDEQSKGKQTISLLKNEKNEYKFETVLQTCQKVEVKANVEDDLLLDNSYILHLAESADRYNILLASDQPFFLQTALSSFTNINLSVMNSKSNMDNLKGYDLYIFDSFSPNTLPSDGAIWLFNIKSNLTNSYFAYQNSNTIDGGAKVSLSKQKGTAYDALSKKLLGNNFNVYKYNEYTIFDNYETIMSYGKIPMVFTLTNAENKKEIVFAFSLNDSNFTMMLDYILLIYNMLDYSLPTFLSTSRITCGETLNFDVPSNCEYIKLSAPSSYSTYVSIQDSKASILIDEIGSYDIEAMIENNKKTYKLFSSFPITEQNPMTEIESLILEGTSNNEKYDSKYEIQWYLFIAFLVLCILEWEVYMYEQRHI